MSMESKTLVPACGEAPPVETVATCMFPAKPAERDSLTDINAHDFEYTEFLGINITHIL